jgi:uncharacterized protein YdaU (DUF1376 family)
MHYYKRNLGDYAKKAGRLTMLQHGAYTLLIDSCYDRETFPTLEQAIEWTWAATEAEVEAVKFVLSRFFKLDSEGCYIQERILAELLEYHAKADKNKQIAIDRETKRKQNVTERAQDVDETPPNHKPLTTNHKPITNLEIPSGISKAQAPKQKAAKRCPADFVVTSEMVEWARENVITVNLDIETQKFKDHEYKTAKTDWPACWRTWMRNAQQYARGSPAIGKQQALEDHNDAVAAQFIKDLENGKRTIGSY